MDSDVLLAEVLVPLPQKTGEGFNEIVSLPD